MKKRSYKLSLPRWALAQRESWYAELAARGLRVQKAEALLKADEEKNVLKIAYECGFDSQNTFYRAYKKEFGHLPRRAVGTKEE